MQAAFFRQIVARRCSAGQLDDRGNRAKSEQQHESGSKITATHVQQRPQQLACTKDQLDAMLVESLQYAKEDVQRFVNETQRAGWNVHPIMLSSYEREPFAAVNT